MNGEIWRVLDLSGYWGEDNGCRMSKESPAKIQPLISQEEMERILSSRRLPSPEVMHQKMAEHLGRSRPLPGRKSVLRDGRVDWVCC